MAIDNIFLGLGRKSVGDVTLYRRAGKQCARVRVRNVRNPRSYKQLFTRSILSNIAQLYATGIDIFNHSFEGRSVGMECQKRFMKLNVDRLRALMTADYNSGAEPSACKARIGARNLKVGVPFEGLQVSEGNYSQMLFSYDPESYGFKLPTVADGETVAAYARRVGLVPNDIYTFLCFSVQPWKDYMANFGPEQPQNNLMCIFPCYMAYAQLKVSADILTDNTPMNPDALLLTLFDYYGGEDVSDLEITAPVTPLAVVDHQSCGGIACIRSKWGSDLRSTSFLQPSHQRGFDIGITYHLLEQAWGDQAGINRADLILDGDNFGPVATVTNPEDYIGTVITIIGSANVVTALGQLAVGSDATLLLNGYPLVFHKDGASAYTVNFVDKQDVGRPSLMYEVATSSTYYATIGVSTSSSLDNGWFNALTEGLGDFGDNLSQGAAVQIFPAPSMYMDY